MIEYYRIPVKANTVSQKEILNVSDQSELKDAIHNKSIVSIKVLQMKNSNINDSTLELLWTISTPLSIISINLAENFSFITDAGIENLCQAQNLTQLKQLNLADNSITDKSIQSISKALHFIRLEELTLYGNSDISSESLIRLADSEIIKNLKKLDLHDTSVCDKGLRYFLSSPNSSQLTHLDLSMNCKRVTDSTFQAIAMSAHCCSLVELKAEDCLISDDGVTFLTQSNNCSKLQSLNLNNSMKKKNNVLTDECLRSIAFAKDMPVFKRLQLRNTDITSKGVNTLSVSLSASNLEILRLSHCEGIKDDAYRYLESILMYRNLTRLYINSTSMGAEQAQKLSETYPNVTMIY